MKVSFESKGNFDNILSWLKRVSDPKPTVAMNQLASEGTRSLAAGTPKVTGETAAGWKSEVKTSGHVVEIAWKNVAHPETQANVAKLIETGHGTRTGGYVPPRPYIKNAMKPVWDQVDNKVVKEMTK